MFLEAIYELRYFMTSHMADRRELVIPRPDKDKFSFCKMLIKTLEVKIKTADLSILSELS